MAATNPFRVSDLVAKYGWQAMIYLAALGIKDLAEAQVLFVDSAHSDALDADDTEHGHSFQKPLATWDYAINLCTADERSIILLAPTHVEALVNAQVDIDVADVATIGIGSGLAKATVTFGHINSSIDIGANNVSVQNVNLVPTVTAVLIGVHVETGKTGCRLKDVKFVIGATPGDEEFVKSVELTSGNDDTVFEDVTILASVGATTTHGIHIAAASDRLTFRNVIIDGPFSTGGIVEDAIGVNHILENCAVDVSGTNYSFQGSSTFAKRTNNVDGQVTEDESESLLLTTRGGGVYPTGVTDSSIWAFLLGASGTPTASTFDNTRDSLQAIGTAVAAITNQTGVINAVGNSPTPNSLQDILSELDGFNTYDNTTDSLEAISNFVRTGITLGAGINLDHLMKTVVVDKQDMDAEVVQGSVLSHICTKTDGDMDDFDPTTDSLEAIADAVTGFTTAVSQTPTARSVQDILEKDGGGTFSAADDSLEAISDLLRTGTALLTGLNLDHFMKTAVADEQDMGPEIAIASVLAHILVKGAGGDVNDFDPTTDSLQAIRDNQQAAARAAIDDAELDHLCELDGTTAYAENIANDSIIAKIMCVGAVATPNTFDNTEDSLQAISEFVRTGTTLGAGIQLDHLLKTSTGVTLDLDLTAYTADFSVMAHVMSATAVGSTFDASTDSLEAISVALAAGTGVQTVLDTNNLDHLAKVTTTVNADDSLASYVITKSILAHIMSANADVTTGYNASTDSLAAIGADNDTIIADIATAQSDLDTLTGTGGAFLETATQTQVDDILADTAVIEPGARRIAIKATGDLTGFGLSQNLFTVSGDVLVRVCASVDVAVTSTSGTTTLEVGIAGNTACLCIQDIVDGAAFVIGDSWTKTVAASDNGAELADEYVIVGNGATIILTGDVDDITAGDIDFYCEWIPLSAGATVTAV